MRVTDRDKIIAQLQQDATELMLKKSNDYASDSDVLWNFKQSRQLTPQQACLEHLDKQLTSLMNALKRNPNNAQAGLKAEPVHSRIVDIINYAELFYCLQVEIDNGTV